MRFLTDENVSRSVLNVLRKQGHDVKDIKEEGLHGISDEGILKIAVKENRVVISHDKDFVNLSRRPPPPHSGIVVLRFFNQNPKNVAERISMLLQTPSFLQKIKEAVIIVSETYIEIIEKE